MTPLSSLCLRAASTLSNALEAMAAVRSGIPIRMSVALLRTHASAKLVALTSAARSARLTGDAAEARAIVLANIPRFELWEMGILGRGEAEAMRGMLLAAAEVFARAEATGDPSVRTLDAVGE